jgi:tellurite methyltransferase
MSTRDRVRWDAIYRERATLPLPAPDPLLLSFTPPVSEHMPHRALDLAAGFGQNGLWLAEQGYIVDIMDISRVALARTHAEVAARGLREVNLLQVDLEHVQLMTEHYHLACVFRYLRRELIGLLRAAIVPGGHVIYETFNEKHLKMVPGFNPNFLLEQGELSALFEGWHILFADESTHISQLVAIKPQQASSISDDG